MGLPSTVVRDYPVVPVTGTASAKKKAALITTPLLTNRPDAEPEICCLSRSFLIEQADFCGPVPRAESIASAGSMPTNTGILKYSCSGSIHGPGLATCSHDQPSTAPSRQCSGTVDLLVEN